MRTPAEADGLSDPQASLWALVGLHLRLAEARHLPSLRQSLIASITPWMLPGVRQEAGFRVRLGRLDLTSEVLGRSLIAH